MQEQRLILDWTKVQDVVPIEAHLESEMHHLVSVKNSLREGTCQDSQMAGWVHYASDFSLEQIENIKPVVESISCHCDAAVVIGIGGSYLGTRAVYESLTHSYANVRAEELHKKPVLFWAGNGLASEELVELVETLDFFSPCLIVVSKTGNTTEPALAFRILKKYLDDRFGDAEANKRVYVVTDGASGSLLSIAKENKYPAFSIPRSVGGRYSVFTACSLLPLMVGGVDVNSFVRGGKQATLDMLDSKNNSIETNPALCYAGIRNSLYQKHGFKVEALCAWSGKQRMLGQWWQQLFGESDGKQNTGLLPTCSIFSADLHSMGQYFQEGERILIATHLKIKDEYSSAKGCLQRKIGIPKSNWNDGLDFISHKSMDYVQEQAQLGTMLAHSDGGVPTLNWEIPSVSPYWLGYWMYTNMLSCAIGGLARGINPFDQPGVESYKQNMFALLHKPGYEDKSASLKARIDRGVRLKSFGFTSH